MITAEELAKEIGRINETCPDNGATWDVCLATALLPFIQSRAAGVQGVDELLRSENPDRKDFTVDEALRIADQNDAAYKHVPSVSRTLASEVRRLATPQPPKDAGAVPMPEPEPLGVGNLMKAGIVQSCEITGYTREQMAEYGDAREAAAIKAMFCSAVPGACPHEVCACAGVKFPDPDDAGRVDDEPVCTCPSGDGSLRHPCPQHPPSEPAARAQVVAGGISSEPLGHEIESLMMNHIEVFLDDPSPAHAGAGAEALAEVIANLIESHHPDFVDYMPCARDIARRLAGGDHA